LCEISTITEKKPESDAETSQQDYQHPETQLSNAKVYVAMDLKYVQVEEQQSPKAEFSKTIVSALIV